jgi:hypothetical protein
MDERVIRVCQGIINYDLNEQDFIKMPPRMMKVFENAK